MDACKAAIFMCLYPYIQTFINKYINVIEPGWCCNKEVSVPKSFNLSPFPWTFDGDLA